MFQVFASLMYTIFTGFIYSNHGNPLSDLLATVRELNSFNSDSYIYSFSLIYRSLVVPLFPLELNVLRWLRCDGTVEGVICLQNLCNKKPTLWFLKMFENQITPNKYELRLQVDPIDLHGITRNNIISLSIQIFSCHLSIENLVFNWKIGFW
jgi:hypothetical protein